MLTNQIGYAFYQDLMRGKRPGQKHYVRWTTRVVALVCVCFCILMLSLFCFNKRTLVSTTQIILNLLHHICSVFGLCVSLIMSPLVSHVLVLV